MESKQLATLFLLQNLLLLQIMCGIAHKVVFEKHLFFLMIF